ncbi:hypothetical protein FLJC2902T_13270 [Flavobacterium limnosediminis JC2902]|uniref:Lipoprotein n=1 Tax=Flavobacterium limnosediminis JC2902 TaxID=1341181 RepID=V6SPX5_9FLAO|nr:hypothetical protein [Flavobacterium limnosediminis]ESU28733.1 hypothetical protein FLJC2902T_13270 [Flavobacterium limnosediminis JC2902]
MKKILFGLITMTMLFSCSKENEIQSTNNGKTSSKIDSELAQKLRDRVYGALSSSKMEDEFDFLNAEKLYTEDGECVIVAKSINFDEKSLSNETLTIGYIESADEFFGDPVIMNVIDTKGNDTEITLELLDIDRELVSTTYIDKGNETVTGVENSSYSKANCIRNSSGCFLDAYSGHGTASVLLTITSAFIPKTTILVYATCMYKNCL